jgi:hypothetical protein
MSDRVEYRVELSIPLSSNPSAEIDKPYLGVFGIIELFRMIDLSSDDQKRVLKTMSEFIGD